MSTYLSENENEKVEDCFNYMINDPDWRADALTILNERKPNFMLDCFLNGSDPEDSDLFRDIIYEFVHEELKE
jgi:hypothetical protein